MHKQKLLELADFIEKLPERKFFMSNWIKGVHYNTFTCLDGALNPDEVCNTACCIAGWAVLQEGLCLNAEGNVYDKDHHYQGHAEATAFRLLELPDRTLFFTVEWPKEFYDRYDDGITPKNKLAAEVIRDYVHRHEANDKGGLVVCL